MKIAKIEEIESCEQQCIYVSSDDHLYITDDYIPTHNTIITGSVSELAFFIEQGGWTEEKILKFFTKLRERIKNRMKGNALGKFILDSSPNNMESCIDKWIRVDAPKDPSIMLVFGSQWDLFPENYPEFFDKDGNEIHNFEVAFPLHKGGGGVTPQVIESKDQLELYNPQDIVWCPSKQISKNGFVNFKDSARSNPIEFLRDQCGLPSSSADRIFYNPKIIEDIFDNDLRNCFSTLCAPAEENPEMLIWNQVHHKFFDYLNGKYFYYYEPSIPRVASVDLATSGDVASLAVSHVERSENEFDQKGNPLKHIVTDFVISLIPYQGTLINIDAFMYFIKELKEMGQMNIIHVSYDSFQSSSFSQNLMRKGFKTEYLSVDKQNEPYLSLIDYAFHGRLSVGKNILVKNNLRSLVPFKRKSGSMKIEHTVDNKPVFTDTFCALNSEFSEQAWEKSFVGSNAKDATDAIAANCFLLTKYSDIYIPYKTWSKTDSTIYSKEKMLQDLESILSDKGFSFDA